jgi:23S rRNA pseudouridine1911/1915/1917 synthase
MSEDEDEGLTPVEIQVDAQSADMRADELIRTHLKLSQREARELFKCKAVRCLGHALARGDRVSLGDSIQVRFEKKPWIQPEPLGGWQVHFESERYVVVFKPSKMHCHPLRRGEGGTLMDGVGHLYPDVVQAGEDEREGGLCHRLDWGTSGLVVIARDTAEKQRLRSLWRTPAVSKGYLALVHGKTNDEGTILKKIAHHASQPNKMVIPGDSEVFRGKLQSARTRYWTVAQTANISLVAVAIEGGARHQIRVHLSDAGHPILGDTTYGGQDRLDTPGLFLHSAHVSLGDGQTYMAAPPPDFLNVAKSLNLELGKAIDGSLWQF